MGEISDQYIRDLKRFPLSKLVGLTVELQRKGNELVGFCPFHQDKNPSFTVNDEKGFFHCFGCGANGDHFTWMKKMDGIEFKEAVERLANEAAITPPITATEEKKKEKWNPIVPVPDGVPPIFKSHYRHGKPSSIWVYHDATGKPLGYIYRFDLGDKEKEILPLTWCKSESGKTSWRWQTWEKGRRPLYGLDRLAARPDAPVAIVEGEKTADAAKQLLFRPVVITWPGGGQAFQYADWSPIQGRKVVIIPDADEPGRKTAKGIAILLHDLGIQDIRMVIPPHDLPSGWDLADALEKDGWTPDQAKEWCQQHVIQWHPPCPENPPAPAMEDEPPVQVQIHEVPIPPPLDAMLYDDDSDPQTPCGPSPFKILGYNKGIFYFLSERSGQVLEFTASSLSSKSHLFELAPLQYWEREYHSKNGFTGHAVDMAVNNLVHSCYQAGVFKPDIMRGRGAWWDHGRTVVHMGDRLIVNGIDTGLQAIDSKYIYEAGTRIRIDLGHPMATDEAIHLYKICERLSWERPIYASLLAGWCIVAPVCGALEWRPHIWLTAGAGGGKTWVMKNIVKPTMGDLALSVLSNTTEAGLRQMLGHDARPVLFDEAESETVRSANGIETVLQLMRQASSESGAHIVKGSAGGVAVSYSIRSAFALSSIGVNIKQMADATRITVLTLKKESSESTRKAFRESVVPLVRDTLTESYCQRLLARTITHLPTLRANAITFSHAVADHIGQQRIGDQLGILLAGVHLLHSDNLVSPDAAMRWVASKDWSDPNQETDEKPEMQILATLMQHQIQVRDGKEVYNRTLGELVAIAARVQGEVASDIILPIVASDELERNGIKILPGDYLAVSNTHQAIQKILGHTSWARGWNRILRRIEGAEAAGKAVRFKSTQSKATIIPLEFAISS
ncbi:MAG: CHC2 zinc finger domain-containing protein [Magnetococcus sp. DMHC-1]